MSMYFQVSIAEDKLAAGPLVAKVYDSSLIKVTDVGNAVVGQQCQFRGKLVQMLNSIKGKLVQLTRSCFT